MLYEDLKDHYNSVCEKNASLKKERDLAIDRANNEIARNGCLEIEMAGLRLEVKELMRELSKWKANDININS